MRILQVVHDFLPEAVGGTEIYTHTLCKELSKRNDICLFFSDSGISIGESIKRGHYDDLAFMSINPLEYAGRFIFLKSLKPGGYFTCTNKRVDRAFKTVIEEFRPDIIHFQHLINLSTNLVNIAYQKEIPMVFTTHDYWLLCPRAHLIDNNLNVCMTTNNKSKCIKCLWSTRIYGFKGINISQPKSYIELPKNVIRTLLNFQTLLHTILYVSRIRPKAIREIIEKVGIFVTPSHRLYDKLVEFGVSRDKIDYLDFGTTSTVSKTIQKKPSQQLRFAFIGPLVAHKGIQILIDAFNNIKKAHLDIYGPLWKNKRGYTKLIKNECIKLKGEFTHEDVLEVFSNIDILIVPSVCMENSPLTIREAFATKTPVIASNIGGLPEMVEDGKSGLLFHVGDTKDLFDKIKYFIDNPSEVKRMSREIRPVKTMGENAIEMEAIYADQFNKRSLGGKK